MFRHQLAVLPAMAAGAAAGEDLEELLDGSDAADPADAGQRGKGGTAAASLGNSYVINLGSLGVREVIRDDVDDDVNQSCVRRLETFPSCGRCRHRPQRDTPCTHCATGWYSTDVW